MHFISSIIDWKSDMGLVSSHGHMASVMSSILWDWANNIFSGRIQQRDRETGNIIFPLLQWEVSGEMNVVQGTT